MPTNSLSRFQPAISLEQGLANNVDSRNKAKVAIRPLKEWIKEWIIAIYVFIGLCFVVYILANAFFWAK